jgi:hypothetical protein
MPRVLLIKRLEWTGAMDKAVEEAFPARPSRVSVPCACRGTGG